MRLVIFGLAISSSWGHGHATLWRGLCRALGAAGHRVVFFERDVPYYARHRDLVEPPGCDLRLYGSFDDVRPVARAELARADVGMVTSYCPDGRAACELVLESHAPIRAFYDLDTPVTLARLARGEILDYLDPALLRELDLVLSFTGGRALDALRALGARRVAPLHGSVDPDVHRPATGPVARRADLSYLGPFAADRQEAVDRLFLEPARRMKERRFLLGGAPYPPDVAWSGNVFHVPQVPPAEHASFYASAPVTLNVARRTMADMGHCPSGRLFEAAACGAALLSDAWLGLESFFEPGREILVASSADDVVRALSMPRGDLAAIGRAARERALAEHTAACRARELIRLLDETPRAVHLTAASGQR